MNQNEYSNELNKHLAQIREIEAHGRQQGSTTMHYTTEDIKKGIDNGKIPKHLGDWYFKWIEEQSRKFAEWQKFITENPEMSPEERVIKFHGPKELSLEESLERYKETVNLGIIHNLINGLSGTGLLSHENIDDLPEKFFKSISDDEFGMSRLMADPLNNVPMMLDGFKGPEWIREEEDGYSLYNIESVGENSLGDTLRLSHRFRAKNQEDANSRSQTFIQRIKGRQKKVLEACWAMANKKLRRTFTCDLSDLMMVAYPNRNETYFSTEEKVEFYQDLIDLSETKLVVTKKEKTKKGRKAGIGEYILPFITIYKTTGSHQNHIKQSEKYPNQISISVLHNPLYEAEKMYSVGAGIKYTTLELRADDLQLAEYIQIRKSQAMKSEYITFTSRSELLKIAGLDGIFHSGMANKKLLQKLERLKEKGIILSYPQKVSEIMRIKIR